MRYKDSGVEWLGKVPEHWKVVSLKKTVDFVNGYAFKSSEYIEQSSEDSVALIRIGDLKDGYVSLKKVKYLNDEMFTIQKDVRVFEDDILVALTGATIGKTAQFKSKVNALLNQRVAIMRSSNKINNQFLKYILQTDSFTEAINLACYGSAQSNISTDQIGRFKSCLPPIEEQRAIAAYLDAACKNIDQAIALKQQQLEVIEEFYKSKISSLIAGLNYEKTKKTEVPWIPTIGEHFSLKPLKRLLSKKLQYGANEPAEKETVDSIRYVRITDLDEKGNLKDENPAWIPLNKAHKYLLNYGDVLFARSGATVGKSFLFSEKEMDACFAGYLIKAECEKSLLLPEYLFYFTKTHQYQKWKEIIFTQSTIQNIGADKYQYLLIPHPSVNLQKEIAEKVSVLEIRKEKIKQNITQQIETLQAYRKSLIHECVTGKKVVVEE